MCVRFLLFLNCHLLVSKPIISLAFVMRWRWRLVLFDLCALYDLYVQENMKKVNELTNSPPADDAPGARGAGAPDMMDILGSMVSQPYVAFSLSLCCACLFLCSCGRGLQHKLKPLLFVVFYRCFTCGNSKKTRLGHVRGDLDSF